MTIAVTKSYRLLCRLATQAWGRTEVGHITQRE